MLADATSITIGSWIAAAAVVIAVFTQVITTFALRRDVEVVNRRVDLVEQDYKALSKQLSEMEGRVNEKGEERAKEIHRRMDDVPGQVIATLRNTKGLL